MERMRDTLTRIALVGGIATAVGGMLNCSENYRTECEFYQGFHRNGSENVYVFDPETRGGRQTATRNQYNEPQISEREAKHKILGDVAFEDSMKIGKKYCVKIKTSPLFADKIVSIKPAEDLE
ncbi:hypothetical protein A3K62_01750 [Candidatus Pacearchaeota archaeon RBG_16_35_8]|nr:MAG: hypothetical protein A3K62_01750 [Candidatus Pacearchaeota archaeon RBG_16_35_8]